jgi:hypothetical protein
MSKLTKEEKSKVMSRVIKTLDLVAKANHFDWRELSKEVIMGMVSMYTEGVKYEKEINSK